jgi:hypothetical protein
MSIGIARSIAVSGAVMGIAGGLLLWLLGYVGPVLFIPITILGALVGAIVFGIPGFLFERKVEREKQEEDARIAALQAAPPASVVVINVAPQGQGGYQQPQAQQQRSIRPWPPVEPLCVIETSDEKDVWRSVRAAALPQDRILGFTGKLPQDIAVEFGLTGVTFMKISRVQGDGIVSPGDLDRIGNLIEMHFSAGPGRFVVLPCLENLVQAGNVSNVRRLLEVTKDIATQTRGSLLVSVDPASLPQDVVATLERGNLRL